MRNYLILLLLQFPIFLSAITGDSTCYLLPQDTIFLSIGDYQEKIFIHEVEKNQTLYSLARFYGLHTEEIYRYNPDLRLSVLSPKQKITIPVPNRAILRYKTKDFKSSQYAPVFYKVKRGDTFFNIATKVFKMPMDTIAFRNQMTSNTLSIGQNLLIGWMSINGIPSSYRKSRSHSEWKRSQSLRKTFVQGKNAYGEVHEQGVAFWQKNGSTSSDRYALHRKAPLNSVIAVTNPMNNRKVYAKVIGRIPENVYGSDVVIVISSKVANGLGAKDPRFFVRVMYKP